MRGFFVVALLTAGLAVPGSELAAQRRAEALREAFVGSEMERYLRVLQIADTTLREVVPWSIRPFGPRELEALAPSHSAHPWAERYEFSARSAGSLGIIRPRAQLIYNSAYPYGAGDGAIWAGRGITMVAHGGVAARWGPLSVTLSPIAFWTQNSGSSESADYRDTRDPTHIDLPTRFGAGPYARVDPGQSSVRLDLPVVTAGISTAEQHWGPGWEYPLLLGNHGGGFPHAFIGTSAPLNIWLGRLSARLTAGQLDQSDYSPVRGDAERRFMSGLTAVFTPRGMSGLELGFGRFYHSPWPDRGIGPREFLRPFEGFLKRDLIDDDPDARAENQLISVFFRWAPPKAGFEAYGEFLRDDHSYDFRHLMLEPNDLSGYAVGISRAWRGVDAVTVLRAEILNTENPRGGRGPAGGGTIRYPYTHLQVRQGHTHRGQLLVPPAAYGGAGAVLGLDRYQRTGRWTLEWRREQHRPRSQADLGDPFAADVLHAWSVKNVRFTPDADLYLGATVYYSWNRGSGENQLGVSLGLGVTPQF